MNSLFSFKVSRIFATLPLLAGFFLSAQTPATQPAAADQGPSHLPEVTAKINTFAHRILDMGIKSNALNGSDLKPWHMKVDISFTPPGKPTPEIGQLEVWSAGPNEWKRVYTSPDPHLNGAEWSVSRFEQYRSKPDGGGFNPFFLNLRATRPVIDPLYQASNIHPDYEMTIKRVNKEGTILSCVAVANPSAHVDTDETNPDFLFPAMCFDDKMHLRATTTPETNVLFDDIQLFQNRSVARDVKVIDKGVQIAEMKVTLLEPWTFFDDEKLKPDKKAVSEPYRIEAGYPKPESVYEVGFIVPSTLERKPFRGTLVVPITIRKDGSVKTAEPGRNSVIQALMDAAEDAINKWKFKPYIVDGQPVEVSYSVHYVLDGKPFVPSYERPKDRPVVTALDDFSSAYDPKRDPAKDLQLAEALAKQTNRCILLDVGGGWCGWCKILDKFFADHGDILKLRDANFVWMKVNMSALNENYPFLSQFPKIPGYPWLFVLDADGKLLVSKNTDDLENGAAGYDDKAVKNFLLACKP